MISTFRFFQVAPSGTAAKPIAQIATANDPLQGRTKKETIAPSISHPATNKLLLTNPHQQRAKRDPTD
jgi:hypothetical protein